jgi:hypothetical protein
LTDVLRNESNDCLIEAGGIAIYAGDSKRDLNTGTLEKLCHGVGLKLVEGVASYGNSSSRRMTHRCTLPGIYA